jgi:hypothetical protein
MSSEKVEKKRKLRVKIPTYIVRNENIELTNDEFLLYAQFCFLYFRNYQNKEIELDHKKLMRLVRIHDTRTLKARFKRLHKLGLVENEINKLPTKGGLTVNINDEVLKSDNPFTILSADIFNHFRNEIIDEYAFRQIFYYKSHINTKDQGKDFCFVGYETLVKKLKISKTKIKEANEQLEKAKLIRVVKHKLQSTYEYDEDDTLIFDRFNNHYYVSNSLH